MWAQLLHTTAALVSRAVLATLQLLICVQSLSRVRFFAILWTVAYQASLSFTISLSLLRFMSVELMMPSNHLILCHLFLLLLSIFPSIRVFSDELVLSCLLCH